MNFSWLKKFEPNISRNLIFYWILVWLQIAGLFVAYHANVLSMIWKEDLTKLTLVIFIIHILVTIKVGIDTARKDKKWINIYWLTSEQTFALGILATIIGFIILLHEGFASGIPTTPEEIKKMFTTVSSGMGVAFFGSLTAITCSIIQKIQAMNLECLRDEQ